jgi:putative ABC transport system ATP-binding protein
MSPLLVVEGLHKAYLDGSIMRRVLDDASLTLHAGEVIALCGPSGSGKTTLLNLVAGLLEPDQGRLVLHVESQQKQLCDLTAAERARIRRRHMGYVFQFFNLVPTLNVRENVLLPLELNRRSDLAGSALGRLSALGLAAHERQYPEQLSGGERQRTAIARALAHEPALVLADEPTGNLDAENAHRVVDLLWREVRALNSGLLIATHDESIAARADRVIRFEQ